MASFHRRQKSSESTISSLSSSTTSSSGTSSLKRMSFVWTSKGLRKQHEAGSLRIGSPVPSTSTTGQEEITASSSSLSRTGSASSAKWGERKMAKRSLGLHTTVPSFPSSPSPISPSFDLHRLSPTTSTYSPSGVSYFSRSGRNTPTAFPSSPSSSHFSYSQIAPQSPLGIFEFETATASDNEELADAFVGLFSNSMPPSPTLVRHNTDNRREESPTTRHRIKRKPPPPLLDSTLATFFSDEFATPTLSPLFEFPLPPDSPPSLSPSTSISEEEQEEEDEVLHIKLGGTELGAPTIVDGAQELRRMSRFEKGSETPWWITRQVW